MGRGRYYSLSEIQKFQPFDKRSAEGIVNLHFIADYESKKIDGVNKYLIGDWMRARRRYLNKFPPRD